MFNRYIAENTDIDFLYISTALKNIDFALISLNFLFNKNEMYLKDFIDEHTYYFFHIQSILTACGQISNVLNNRSMNRDTRQRSKRLREFLNLSCKDFPLIFQKEARNTNEHYDERYDKLYGLFGDYNLIRNNSDKTLIKNLNTELHLRTYDIDNQIYNTYNSQFKPIKYNFNDLRTQLYNLQILITQNPKFHNFWTDFYSGEKLI